MRGENPSRDSVSSSRPTRCRLHGGLSTGPKSAEGRARIAAAHLARWAAARVAKGKDRGSKSDQSVRNCCAGS